MEIELIEKVIFSNYLNGTSLLFDDYFKEFTQKDCLFLAEGVFTPIDIKLVISVEDEDIINTNSTVIYKDLKQKNKTKTIRRNFNSLISKKDKEALENQAEEKDMSYIQYISEFYGEEELEEVATFESKYHDFPPILVNKGDVVVIMGEKLDEMVNKKKFKFTHAEVKDVINNVMYIYNHKKNELDLKKFTRDLAIYKLTNKSKVHIIFKPIKTEELQNAQYTRVGELFEKYLKKEITKIKLEELLYKKLNHKN